MQDIIPFGSSNKKKKASTKRESEHVVELGWKLPARLRRPIRTEIAKQERRQKEREAVVSFERRPIVTETPIAPPPRFKKNVGAEHHTGDVYMKSRPDIQLPTPPYAGYISRSANEYSKTKDKLSVRHKVRLGELKKASDMEKQRDMRVGQQKVAQLDVKQSVKTSVVVTKKKPAVVIGAERDVTYDFGLKQRERSSRKKTGGVSQGAAEEESIRKAQRSEWLERGESEAILIPKSRIPSPSGFSQFIRSRLAAFKGKRLALNMAVLLIGCLMITGLLWNLRGLSQGLLVFSSVEGQAKQAYEELMAASVALANVDFPESERAFGEAGELLNSARLEMDTAMSSSQRILRYLDVTGTVRSGQELLKAGDELSLAGQHLTRGMKSLMERDESVNLVDAIGLSQQEFIEAEKNLQAVEVSLGKVNSPFLPDEISVVVDELNESVPRIRGYLEAYIDRSSILLAVLGVERDRQYLLLFENNHEIRPTGGFIGSVGLVNIDRGAVEEIDVKSVYDPDGQLRENIAPPEPLRIVTNRWYMRDANWFVDFPVSARKIIEFFEKEGGPTVDGVIALTPEVVRELLEVSGPVEVPAYDVTVNTENFWELVQDQVSYSYDKEENQPKQFLADLTPLLLDRIFAGSAESSLQVLQGLTKMIHQRHLLVYLNNDELQGRLQELGWAGDLPKGRAGFLAVNNANIAGHKSDQFVEQEVDYRLELQEGGFVEAMVIIRRTHNGPQEVSDYSYPEDENPALKDNIVYQRVLVPKGAKLLEAKGFTAENQLPHLVEPESNEGQVGDPDLVEWQTGQVQHENGTVIGEEAGYSFFANWMMTKPGETSMALYRYRLPEKISLPGMLSPVKELEGFVYKQPGDMRSTIRVAINLPKGMRIVHTVPSDGITQTTESEVVYRGGLNNDILVGVVFEEEK